MTLQMDPWRSNEGSVVRGRQSGEEIGDHTDSRGQLRGQRLGQACQLLGEVRF